VRDILTLLEGFYKELVFGEMGKHPKLDLGIIST